MKIARQKLKQAYNIAKTFIFALAAILVWKELHLINRTLSDIKTRNMHNVNISKIAGFQVVSSEKGGYIGFKSDRNTLIPIHWGEIDIQKMPRSSIPSTLNVNIESLGGKKIPEEETRVGFNQESTPYLPTRINQPQMLDVNIASLGGMNIPRTQSGSYYGKPGRTYLPTKNEGEIELKAKTPEILDVNIKQIEGKDVFYYRGIPTHDVNRKASTLY